MGVVYGQTTKVSLKTMSCDYQLQICMIIIHSDLSYTIAQIMSIQALMECE